MRKGVVALVGAGPGDPGLLTVRGRWWLRRADVVVYDRLVEPRLLDEAPRGALRIFAGKGSGHHSLPQEEINAILIAQAQRGRRVVRLKGGDPFVFGRGAEEAEALTAVGIRCEIVPGVSSAVAVPAAAGIPVTDRRLASSFAVVTGHECTGRARPRVDWRGLATSVDTLVILMGLANLRHITTKLIAHGRPANTPTALIERGTTPSERVIIGTLANIAERAATAGLTAPVTIVIGEVVRLRNALGASSARGAANAARRGPSAGFARASELLGEAWEGAVEAPSERKPPSEDQPPRYARRTSSLPRRSAARPSRTIRPVSIT